MALTQPTWTMRKEDMEREVQRCSEALTAWSEGKDTGQLLDTVLALLAHLDREGVKCTQIVIGAGGVIDKLIHVLGTELQAAASISADDPVWVIANASSESRAKVECLVQLVGPCLILPLLLKSICTVFQIMAQQLEYCTGLMLASGFVQLLTDCIVSPERSVFLRREVAQLVSELAISRNGVEEMTNQPILTAMATCIKRERDEDPIIFSICVQAFGYLAGHGVLDPRLSSECFNDDTLRLLFELGSSPDAKDVMVNNALNMTREMFAPGQKERLFRCGYSQLLAAALDSSDSHTVTLASSAMNSLAHGPDSMIIQLLQEDDY
jgi:hypothetical protein